VISQPSFIAERFELLSENWPGQKAIVFDVDQENERCLRARVEYTVRLRSNWPMGVLVRKDLHQGVDIKRAQCPVNVQGVLRVSYEQ
jgi:hypothetical protein